MSISKDGRNIMKYRMLTVGLKDNLISWSQAFSSAKSVEFKSALDINEAAHILEKETFHLLALNMDYLRSIGQSGWLLNVRRISFIPIVVLSAMQEVDVGPAVEAGADICLDSDLPPPVILILLWAQLRRYTAYNHFDAPETAPFQIGDIGIDPSRHIVWVCGKQVTLYPREFSLLLYFMRNPNHVLSQEQICKHAWKKEYPQDVTPSIHMLRKKIEPDPANPIYIETVHRVGYRFIGNSVETCGG